MQSIALRILAALLGFRGALNLVKSWGAGSGMVFFGKMLPITTIVAPIVGVYMLLYSFGLWTKKTWALPMGYAYAMFATLNVILFPLVEGLGPEIQGWRYIAFGFLGIGLPWAAVLLLRAELKGARHP